MPTEYYLGCPPPDDECIPYIDGRSIIGLLKEIIGGDIDLYIESSDQVYIISFDPHSVLFHVTQFSTWYSIPQCKRDPMNLMGVIAIIDNNSWNSAILDYGDYDVLVYDRRKGTKVLLRSPPFDLVVGE